MQGRLAIYFSITVVLILLLEEILLSPVDVGSISHCFYGFYTSQVVVWDFWTINSITLSPIIGCMGLAYLPRLIPSTWGRCIETHTCPMDPMGQKICGKDLRFCSLFRPEEPANSYWLIVWHFRWICKPTKSSQPLAFETWVLLRPMKLHRFSWVLWWNQALLKRLSSFRFQLDYIPKPASLM